MASGRLASPQPALVAGTPSPLPPPVSTTTPHVFPISPPPPPSTPGSPSGGGGAQLRHRSSPFAFSAAPLFGGNIPTRGRPGSNPFALGQQTDAFGGTAFPHLGAALASPSSQETPPPPPQVQPSPPPTAPQEPERRPADGEQEGTDKDR
ncbi:hypothetical protein PAPYR_1684 [Paratrimastix pyriformis]|uniref:Uncharacterized protein n=1 Tax=Paratrimastix pyriformis TaxID=342808 RepID=A0ABQ8US78_9EUKA|nr:hypothetical protein PAPYR_1684 [Paratrimastix pyriformis]